MTTTVVMLRTAPGEYGKDWYAGDTKTCSDRYADFLIGRGDAYDAAGLRADVSPVSGAGNHGLRAVYFGHSYADQEDISGTFALNATNAQGSITWANALLGHPLTVIKGAGVGGERIQDIIQRYAVHVAPYNPDIIFIPAGHNDLNNVINVGSQKGTGIPYVADPTQTWLTSVIARYNALLDLIPLDTIVVLMAETQPGRNLTGVATSNTHKQLGSRFNDLNYALQRMALKRPNVVYVPVDLPLMDAASVNFEVTTGSYVDNVHPGVTGGFKRGRMLAKHLERLLPRVNAPLASNVGDAFLNQRLAFTGISVDGATITVTMDNSAPGQHVTLGRIKRGDMVVVQCPLSPTYDGTYPCIGASPTGIVLAGAATGATAAGNVCTSRQMIENPVFTNQAGGSKAANVTLSSGTVPSGYSLNTTAGAGVVSVSIAYVPHSDPDNLYSCGYWVELTVTTTGAADLILQATASDESGGSYYRRLHAGDEFYAGCEVDVSGTVAGYMGTELRALFAPTNVIAAEFFRDPAYTGTDGPNAAHRITLMTPEMAIPAGFTGLTTQIYMRWSAATAGTVIRIGRVSTYRVDDPIRAAADPLAVQ